MVSKKSQPRKQVRLTMRGDSLHPIFLTSLFYSMLHLVHAAVSRIGWCISEAHTGLLPGAPCSPALTLCGAASAPSAGEPARTAGSPWTGAGSVFSFPHKSSCSRLPRMGKGWRGESRGSRSRDRRCCPVLAPERPQLLLLAGEGGVFSPDPRLVTGPSRPFPRHLPQGHTEERGTLSPGG